VLDTRAIDLLPRIEFVLGILLGCGLLLRSRSSIWDWLTMAVYAIPLALLIFRLRIFGGRDDPGRSPRVPGWFETNFPRIALLIMRAPISSWLAAFLLLVGVLGFLLGLLAGFIPALRDPVLGTLAWLFPGPTVALLGLALMIGPFTLLTHLGDNLSWPRHVCGVPSGFRMPVVSGILALLFIATAIFPLHTLRAPPDGGSVVVRLSGVTSDLRQPGSTFLDEWRKACAPDAKPARPIIVAISGGASRAGVAGAAVLYQLDSLAAQHGVKSGTRIFAISSVSGGSLGAAAYLALLAGEDQPDACRSLSGWTGEDARRVLAERLGQDALGPILAGSLFGDIPRALAAWPMLGQFLPDGGDRAEAIERGFEQLWNSAIVGADTHGTHPIRFDRPFLSLFYQTNADGQVVPRKGMPIWIGNGTDANTGVRILTTPFRPVSQMLASWRFTAAGDFLAIAGHDVAISTAINNTARFPYLEPSGDLRRDGSVQIVDGGYFENQGLSTARDLAGMLSPDIAAPIVVQVTADSDPAVNEARKVIRCSPGLTDDPEAVPLQHRPLQLLAPVLALYNVRGGHSAVALRDAVAAMCSADEPRFFHFYLPARKVDGVPREVPMNWVMSTDTADFIWQAMRDDRVGEAVDVGNAGEWDRLTKALQR